MAVASNNAAAAACFGEFSDVVTTSSVSGQWKVADIGLNPGNDPDKLYVGLSDSSNKTASVVHPDPAAVNLTDWTEWKIPLSSFTGVNLSRVKKICHRRRRPQGHGPHRRRPALHRRHPTDQAVMRDLC